MLEVRDDNRMVTNRLDAARFLNMLRTIRGTKEGAVKLPKPFGRRGRLLNPTAESPTRAVESDAAQSVVSTEASPLVGQKIKPSQPPFTYSTAARLVHSGAVYTGALACMEAGTAVAPGAGSVIGIVAGAFAGAFVADKTLCFLARRTTRFTEELQRQEPIELAVRCS